MTTLNPNARKLVIELRKTPEKRGYRQGRGQLHRASDGARCCLGVGCELYQREVGGLSVRERDDLVYYDETSTALPECVQEWLGFRNFCGDYVDQQSLQIMNDDGVPFDQIADIIERKPEGLFV